MPQRRKGPSASPAENIDPLAESVDRLSAEVRVLRDVLAEVREDFSWLTHGQLLPVLNALDEVRAALLAAMQQQNDDREVGKPETEFASEPASQVPQAQPQTTHAPDVPLGRLF